MVGVVGSNPIAPTNLKNMIKITLPDGSIKEFESTITLSDVAYDIGEGLGRAALAGHVDGKLVDLSHEISSDVAVSIVTAKNDEGLNILRHSTAHLLAYAVKELFPEAQVTIGPTIDDGFYYDFSYHRTFTPEDLNAIEKKMTELVKEDHVVTREVMKRDDAVKFFLDQGEKYKAEIIKSIPQDEEVTVYHEGKFSDLCRGPHVPSTGKLKVFKLMKVAGAYWRGDSKNEMLQRIYGTAWANKKQLKQYLTRIAEAEKRDHRKIGKKLDLFHIQEEAPGMVFWHPAGWTIYQVIEQYMRKTQVDHDYHEIKTPQLVDLSLWKKSGHADKFGDDMFMLETDDREF